MHRILTHPDPRLNEKAQAVSRVDAPILALVRTLFETMYEAQGCGLAAPQIGKPLRIFVVDEGTPLVFINPEVTEVWGTHTWKEGCLSMPGFCQKVARSEKVRIRALDAYGKPFELEAQNALAAVISHEMDHLEGVLLGAPR